MKQSGRLFGHAVSKCLPELERELRAFFEASVCVDNLAQVLTDRTPLDEANFKQRALMRPYTSQWRRPADRRPVLIEIIIAVSPRG